MKSLSVSHTFLGKTTWGQISDGTGECVIWMRCRQACYIVENCFMQDVSRSAESFWQRRCQHMRMCSTSSWRPTPPSLTARRSCWWSCWGQTESVPTAKAAPAWLEKISFHPRSFRVERNGHCKEGATTRRQLWVLLWSKHCLSCSQGGDSWISSIW